MVDKEALERRWAFFRLHLNSLKQMTSENRAVFLERLVWWEYQDQSKKIVDRIISKFKECNSNLDSLLLTNSDDAGVEDFIFIDHSLLDSQRSSILRNIEVLVLEYHHLSYSKKQKVGMQFNVLHFYLGRKNKKKDSTNKKAIKRKIKENIWINSKL